MPKGPSQKRKVNPTCPRIIHQLAELTEGTRYLDIEIKSRVTESAIRSWFRGRTLPTIDHFRRVLKIFGFDLAIVKVTASGRLILLDNWLASRGPAEPQIEPFQLQPPAAGGHESGQPSYPSKYLPRSS